MRIRNILFVCFLAALISFSYSCKGTATKTDDGGGGDGELLGNIAEGGACTKNEDCLKDLVCTKAVCAKEVVEDPAAEDKDKDDDGIEDLVDNCVDVVNADQADLDGDKIGDVCDEDIDGDDVLNDADNCKVVANADQKDNEGDGLGDECDEDDDDDSVLDTVDNCQFLPNPDQTDDDKDGKGKMCEGGDLMGPVKNVDLRIGEISKDCQDAVTDYINKAESLLANQIVIEIDADTKSVECLLDGVVIDCPPNGLLNVAGMSEGIHSFYIEAMDENENKNTLGCSWTVDTMPPKVASVEPKMDAEKVLLDTNITVKFTKSVIMKEIGPVENPLIMILPNAAVVPGIHGFDSKTGYTFKPSKELEPNTKFEATLYNWFFTDAAGNVMVENYVWNFITKVVPQQFLYAVNFGDGNLSLYKIDEITGKLTQVQKGAEKNIIACSKPHSIVMDPAGEYAYVTDLGIDDLKPAGEILVYLVDKATGWLNLQLSNVTGASPTGIIMDKAGKYVYTIDYKTNAIYTYEIKENKINLQQIDVDLTGVYPYSLVMHPSGKFIYVTNMVSYTVSKYLVNSNDGTLTNKGGFKHDNHEYPLSLAIHPSGKYLYVTYWFTGKVSTFSIDDETGDLVLIDDEDLANPVAISLDNVGAYAYVVNEQNEIVAYAINGDGKLDIIPDQIVTQTGNGPYHIAIDSNNGYLYVLNNLGASISNYRIGDNSGLLEGLGDVVFTGVNPTFIYIRTLGE